MMKHRLRNRIVLNSMVILFILSIVMIYTAIASIELSKSFDLLLQNNLVLKDIQKNLDETQNNLTAYLRAKNSESLKDYIRYASDLQVLAGKLNREIKDDQLLLLERNLAILIENYLASTDNAVQAKRGRNVSTYVSQYDEAKKIEGLIKFLLEKMNTIYLDEALTSFMGYRTNISIVLFLNLLLIMLAFLVSSIFMMRYSSILTEPLEHLSETVKAVERGDYSHNLPPYEEDDEIGTLNHAFKRMQKSIQNAFEELNKKAELEKLLLEQKMQMLDYQHKLKDAELLALQTQINPHFLYNTLSAGWQLALAEQDETTAEFLEKLAEFIRYVLKPTNRFVPISEELDCANKYIWLLKLRFAERYQFEIQVDERALPYETPALVLQPLIENAITHGLHDLEQGGRVTISVQLDEASWMIQLAVADTGKGMKKEDIEEVMKAAQLDDSGEHSGIGLFNVIRRITLSTAGRGHVSIESTEGQGSKVIIYIPMELHG